MTLSISRSWALHLAGIVGCVVLSWKVYCVTKYLAKEGDDNSNWPELQIS